MVKIIKEILFVVVVGVSTLFAAPGDLDLNFGTDGKVIAGTVSSDHTRSVAIQKDGKIIVAGIINGLQADGSQDFEVTRFNPSGELDLTFGVAGIAIIDVGISDSVGSDHDDAYSVAIQEDGKIVVAGYSYNGSNTDFSLIRLNVNGDLDTTFGVGGKVLTDFSSHDRGYSVAIQSDGKIVVAGTSYQAAANGWTFTLARYDVNGTLDPTFANNGKMISDFSGGYAYSVALQDDGKIVVGGFLYAPGTNSDFAVARYNSNGQIDQTFGINGKVLTDFENNSRRDVILSMAIQTDGKIVAAGFAEVVTALGTINNFALARYDVNGTLDPTFGVDGKVTTNFGTGSSTIRSMDIQDDGKIVVTGSGTTYPTFTPQFSLARYNIDGNLDPTFGLGGEVTTSIGLYGDLSYALAIQSDGKIVVSGTTFIGYTGSGTTFIPGNDQLSLVRYEVEPVQKVDIDIQPDDPDNIIKLKLINTKCIDNKLKVAILSTIDYDVTEIDPLSVKLSDPKLEGKSIPQKMKIQDIDDDEDDDLVFEFSTCNLYNQDALNLNTTELVLTGKTFDDIGILGSDTVQVSQ